LSFPILVSDTLRKILFPSPQYKESENKRLFSACHVLIEELLKKGMPVIFDATNLLEHHREYLYRAAERAGAKLILVWVEAPTEVVRHTPSGLRKSSYVPGRLRSRLGSV